MKFRVRRITLPNPATSFAPPTDFWGKLAQALGLKQF